MAQAVQFFCLTLKIEALQGFETSKIIVSRQGAASGKTNAGISNVCSLRHFIFMDYATQRKSSP